MVKRISRGGVFLFFLTFLSTVFAQKSKEEKVDTCSYALPMPDSATMLSPVFITNETPKILAVFRPSSYSQLLLTAIASSWLEKGRILALGSSSYLKDSMLNFPAVKRMLDAVISGAGNANQKQKIGLLGPDIVSFRNALGAQNEFYDIEENGLEKGTTVIMLSKDIAEKSMVDKVETFVRSGGTLLFASPFGEIRHGEHDINAEVTDLNINSLLVKAGLYNMRNPLFSGKKTGDHLSDNVIPPYLHPKTLFPWLAITDLNEIDYYIEPFAIVPTIELVFKNLKVGDPIANLVTRNFPYADSSILIDKHHPLKIENRKARWGYKFNQMLVKKALDNKPTSKGLNYTTFPGTVDANANRDSKRISLLVKVGREGIYEPTENYRRPQSTGLYVPAGETVVIKAGKEYLSSNIAVQIGVHNDDLTDLDSFSREGVDLTRSFELNESELTVFSPYGGLLLINIPDSSTLKKMVIEVTGAVEAPYFVLNKTTNTEWVSHIRNNPGPWAELASDKIILTVPSNRIRLLKDPQALLSFWDKVMDANARLADIPITRLHPERIIIDESVAFGYMFTTREKIVVPDDESCQLMLDKISLQKEGSWGHFHEIGHRHQFRDLDFEGIQEISVNLFTLYTYYKVLNRGVFENEKFPDRESMWRHIDGFLGKDPTFQKWKQQPFVALSMYVELIDQFGWNSIEKSYQRFRALPKAQYPKTDQEKIDLWFTTICEATETNLSEFFDVWGFPVSQVAKSSVRNLKTWMPEGLIKYRTKQN